MKHVLVAATLAGSASCSLAQEFSLTLQSGSTFIHSGSTFTVAVYGDANVGTHLLGGAFSLVSSGECITSMEWTPAAWSGFNTDGGYAGNGDYNEVIFGQLVIPGIFPPAPGSELGNAIGAFTITLDTNMDDFFIDFQLVAASPFSLETVDESTGQTFQSSNGTLSLGSVSVLVGSIPSPGVLTTACLGGLLASRRRR